MTVTELINLLQTVPGDLDVVTDDLDLRAAKVRVDRNYIEISSDLDSDLDEHTGRITKASPAVLWKRNPDNCFDLVPFQPIPA